MKLTDQVFVTSDHHFGHARMVEWGYRELGWEEVAVEEWNSVVRDQDIVLHLGDLALCRVETAQNWLPRLNGRKYLVLGNHDRFNESAYTNFGFTVIPNPVFFNWNHGEPIIFTHKPYENLPTGWWNYHGHLHGNKHHQINSLTNRHIDCGVDVWGLKPRKISEIYSYIKLQQQKTSGELLKL
ncbi:MAG: hypothetical protein KCHDKBKB_00716 [Elusimicrobia bacterium]|nr:hypothetical protein [Elusimicrobiota bacterium]